MKSFFYLLLFYQDTGFISNGKNYVQSSFINLIKILMYGNINKYEKILLIRNLIFKLLSILFIPLSIILYLLKFKIYSTTPNSIGSYFEQLEVAQEEEKIIIISPKCWCCNKFLEKYFFEKRYYFIKNNFFASILIPLTFINFIRFSIYKKKKIFFNQKQYYINFKEKNLQYEHDLIFNNSSKKKFSEILNSFDISIKKIQELFTTQLNLNLEKKICVIHIRNEKNDYLRNNNLKTCLKTINYLEKNNFLILIFSKENFEINSPNVIFIDDNDRNKQIQILSIILCNLYLGPISGPFHLAKFLNKDMVITDCVIYNHLIYQNNFKVIYKKYFKNSKVMSFKSVLENNIECIWDKKILDNKGISVIDNNENEILNATIEVLKKNFDKTIEQNEIKLLFKEKNYSKNSSFLMMRNTSNYFLKNLIVS